MSVVALIHPTSLVGKELREQLEERPQLYRELRLLSTLDDEIGTLARAGNEATVIALYEPERLHGVDLVFFCGEIAGDRALVGDLGEETTAIFLSCGAGAADGVAVVAGVNSARARAGDRLVSPHPAAVLLAHLLHPLRELGLEEAVATLIQPVSIHGERGLEEVFQQARSILAFDDQPEPLVFGRQLAFNLLPSPAGSGLAPLVREIVGLETPLALTVLQGSAFHSLAASLYVVLPKARDARAIRRALARHPAIQLAEKPELLGPIDAAARPRILVGAVAADDQRPGGYWIWAVMDNLTTGGALNALQLAELLIS